MRKEEEYLARTAEPLPRLPACPPTSCAQTHRSAGRSCFPALVLGYPRGISQTLLEFSSLLSIPHKVLGFREPTQQSVQASEAAPWRGFLEVSLQSSATPNAIRSERGARALHPLCRKSPMEKMCAELNTVLDDALGLYSRVGSLSCHRVGITSLCTGASL